MTSSPPEGKPIYRCLTGADDDQFCMAPRRSLSTACAAK
jgi:hypothetical protein